MRGAVLLTILLSLLAASAASASSPTQYRSKLNAICRSYTPQLKAQERAMAKAEKAKDGRALGFALGRFLVYGLTQDVRIEAQPVPALLLTPMRPILALMRKIDGHVHLALQRALASDNAGLASQLKTIATLAKPLNAGLDAAGLRDCGSNQS